MPDEGLAAVAELQGIGDRDDLHDAGVLQALHATSHAASESPTSSAMAP
jgi:hypothetical protein